MTPSCAIRRRNASTLDRRLLLRAGGGEAGWALFPSFNWLMHIWAPHNWREFCAVCGRGYVASFIIMFFRYWHHNLINRDDITFGRRIFVRSSSTRKWVTPGVITSVRNAYSGRRYRSRCCLAELSGVIIWRPYFALPFSIPVIRFALMLHSLPAVALIVVIMVHIYAALWVKGTITPRWWKAQVAAHLR